MDKIRKIILVSGPPCSGKTYFIENSLNNSKFIQLVKLSESFKIRNANSIREHFPVNENNKELVVHYDCMRSYKRGIKISADNDKLLQFIESEQSVDIFILKTDVRLLEKRMKDRIIRLKDSISLSRLSKLYNLLSLYQNTDLYEKELNKWIDYCRKNFNKSNVHIITSKKNDEFSIKSLSK